jgi:hypothetical protein
MIVLALVLALSNDEPNDDGEPRDLPFEGIDHEEVPPPDEDPDPTPTPEPTPIPPPVRRTFLEVLTYREAAVFSFLFFYAAVYFAGRASIRRKLTKLSSAVLVSLRRHFASASRFTERNVHVHRSWVTGRVGYRGAVVTADFKCACDPLGIVYSVFRGHSDKFSIEFILTPPHVPSGILHIAKEAPPFVGRLQLKAVPVGHRYSAWTDFGEAGEKLVRIVKGFIENYPTALSLIEMSDTNRFETKRESAFVAKFEFRICGPIETFVTDELIDFCVNAADEFCGFRLPGVVQQRNQKLRETLLKEEEPKKDEKKETAEEDEKAQRRRERREKRGKSPKVKVVRQ